MASMNHEIGKAFKCFILYFISLVESIVYNMMLETWNIWSLVRQWYGIILVGQSSGFGIRFNSLAPDSTTSFFKLSSVNWFQPLLPHTCMFIPSNNFGYYITKISNKIFFKYTTILKFKKDINLNKPVNSQSTLRNCHHVYRLAISLVGKKLK